MATGLQLGVDELPVDFDFKRAAAGGDQRPGVDLRFEFLEQFGRDTHGFGGIVSSHAIFNCHFLFRHFALLFGLD